jgi:hypothetical protein
MEQMPESNVTTVLWTWQTCGFDIKSANIDLSKSAYFSLTPRIEAGYKKLHQRLGTDQLVWCTTNPEKWCQSSLANPSRVQWRIEIQTSKVLALIDPIVWTMFIDERGVPCDKQREWKTEALKNDVHDVEAHVKRRCREYLAPYDSMTKDELWEKLFCETWQEGVNALIRCPVEGQAVILYSKNWVA